MTDEPLKNLVNIISTSIAKQADDAYNRLRSMGEQPMTLKNKTIVKKDQLAYVLRSCKVDGSSRNNFKYPLQVGDKVKCSDWDSKIECGNGLHGLRNGSGNPSLLYWEDDVLWQVYECQEKNIIDIGKDKCKFSEGTLVFSGAGLAAYADAWAFLIEKHVIGKASSGYFSTSASSGYSSTSASSGYYSTSASSGYSSTSASSGYSSTSASSGNFSTSASSGNYSKSASSGYSSTSASSGYSSKSASSGNYSTSASSGYSSKSAAKGKRTIAMVAGINGQAKAGVDGAIALSYYDKKDRARIVVGHVGEDIKADTWYKVEDGKLVEVVK